MKRKLLFIAMLAVIFAGCQQKKSNVIEIGAILPLTGYSASNGTLFNKGLELALEEINQDSSGILINMNLEDCKSSPKDGLMAYRKLESKGIKYYVGFGGQFVLGYSSETNNSDKVLFISAAPNQNILSLSNRTLRIFPNTEMVTDKIRDYAVSCNYSNVAIIYMQNEAYSMYYESALKKLKAAGINVVFVETYDPNCRDFRNIVNKLSQYKVDMIYSAGVGESSALLTKQLYNNSATSNIPIIGDMNFSTPDNLKIIGEVKSPLYCIDSYMDKTFVEKYTDKYNQSPNAYAVYGYIIPYILKEAVLALGTDVGGEAVYEYIRTHVFTTAAGEVSFDQTTGEPVLNIVVNSTLDH